MLIEADANEAAGVKCDVRGALESGRVAVGTFFEFWDGLRSDAAVWWVFQHRAFEEAVRLHVLAGVIFCSLLTLRQLTMATLLSTYHPGIRFAYRSAWQIGATVPGCSG